MEMLMANLYDIVKNRITPVVGFHYHYTLNKNKSLARIASQ